MTKVHNFSAGPAILPEYSIQNGIEALKNFSGTNLSILEVSHRSPEFVDVMDSARALAKELLHLNDAYEVLFLQGGASTQFLMVAYNLLSKKAAYLDTGTWSTKAIKEAKAFGDVDVVASGKDHNYTRIPKAYSVSEDSDYFHVTSNNTIYGTQIQDFPKVDVPLICDMSSDILSRDVDGKQFDLIYAGAQKNLGPAGATLVAIKKDVLGKVQRHIPTMLDYNIHINKGSMFNTPPVFSVFVTYQTLKWVKETGIAKIESTNKEKANALYSAIESNELFRCPVDADDRSHMNATFLLNDDALNDKFLDACKEANISGIKGHRSVGGFRASMYNALGIDSVKALVNVMETFN
jgi:phosphoserine aminotransferase